jgi:hypothetical protein
MTIYEFPLEAQKKKQCVTFFSVLRTLVWPLQKAGTNLEACGAITQQCSNQSGKD